MEGLASAKGITVCSKNTGPFFWLLAVLSLALSLEPIHAQGMKPISPQELTILLNASQSLRLKLSLLTDSLQASKQTISDLQIQLDSLEKQVSSLQDKLTQASDTSTGLRTTSTELTQSFAQYKTEVLSEISRLETQNWVFGISGAVIGAGILESIHLMGVIK